MRWYWKCLMAVALLLVLSGQAISVEAAGSSPKTASISGMIAVDRLKGAPLAGARIVLQPAGRTTQTVRTGRFQFRNVKPGTYRLAVSKRGYRFYTTPPLVIRAGERLETSYYLPKEGPAAAAFNCPAAPAAPSLAMPDPARTEYVTNQLDTVSRDLSAAHLRYARSSGAAREDGGRKLVAAAAVRKLLLAEAMGRNPAAALAAALTASERRTLSGLTKGCVEASTTVEGTLEVLQADNVAAKTDATEYTLVMTAGRRIRLHPAGGLHVGVESRTRVRIKGLLLDDEMVFDGRRPLSAARDQRGGLDVLAQPGNPPVLGPQRIAILLVNFQNTPRPSLTKAQVQSFVTARLAPYYEENSYRQVSLTVDVFGWYMLPLKQTCASITFQAMAAADPDVSFQNYSRLIILAPYGPNCSFDGFSTIGRVAYSTADGMVAMSVAQIVASAGTNLLVNAHELGHGFGLGHASFLNCGSATIADTGCTIDEYGDWYDLMAVKQPLHLSAPHKEYVGWLGPSNIQTVTASGTYVIEPLETATNGLKALKIRRSNGPDRQYLYIEYRQPLGFDVAAETGVPGSNVYAGALLHTVEADQIHSLLLDPTPDGDRDTIALLPGSTFIDPATQAKIAVVAATPGALTVKVTLERTDFSPPTVSLTAPSDGATVSGLMTVSASASDASGIGKVEFWRSGASAPFATAATAPYTAMLDTAVLPNGTLDLWARAYDLAGAPFGSANNVADSPHVQLTVANTDAVPPTVVLTAPTNGATVPWPLIMSADAGDNVGIWKVVWQLDQGVTYTSWQKPYQASADQLTAGVHTLTATAYDFVGNTKTTPAISFTVVSSDASPPAVALTDPLDGATVVGTITVSAAATDNVGVTRVEFFKDGEARPFAIATTAPYTAMLDTAVLPSGEHILRVRAYDAAGNATTSADRHFIVGAALISPTSELQDVNISCPPGETNYYGTCMNVLKLFGQTKLGETSPNMITANKTYTNPGVVVDRSSNPNKVYVVDLNNNRILGWSSIGVSSGNPNLPCTDDSDVAPGDTCVVNPARPADIVLGQPDFQSGACNQDSNLGQFRRPRADTLCLQNFPFEGNLAEAFYSINFDVDQRNGDLYIADTYNNRVLKYNQPLSQNRTGGNGDAIADFVYGQPDFQSNELNEGLSSPDATSVAFTVQYKFPNLSVDPSGNVWVGDMGNGRVMRFPPNNKTADLILNNAGAASVNSRTGELYVWGAQISVYAPPFSSSMTPTRVMRPTITQTMTNGRTYVFEPMSYNFNPYRQGALVNGDFWVNEFIDFGRTILIDTSGNIIKEIGSTALNQPGSVVPAACGNLQTGYYDWQPLGSVGFDDDNNIYIASTIPNVISRYKLPADTYTLPDGTVCPAKPNSGLLLNNGSVNVPDPTGAHLAPNGGGVAGYQGQVVATDDRRVLAWNNFLSKPYGAAPDVGVNFPWPLPGASFTVDDQRRLWTTIGGLKAYPLPLTSTTMPLTAGLFWKDTGAPLTYGDSSGIYPIDYVAFDALNKKLWLSDSKTSRVFRISNYYDISTPGAKLYVDMVIGQPDRNATNCNQGLSSPNAQTLCHPTSVAVDHLGNLYVNDDDHKDLTCGNNRVLVYLAQDLNSAMSMFPNLSAKRIFNVDGSFTTPGNCGLPRVSTLALDNANRLLVAQKGLVARNSYNFPLKFYRNPLSKQTPDAYIPIPAGYMTSVAFDEQDNLIIQDSTWPKVWVINLDQDPQWLWPLGGGAATFDFSLYNSGDITVAPGQAGSTTVTAGLISGTVQSVSFTASGLPTGATASFSTPACTPTCSTTLNITTSPTTPVGWATVTVTGTGGGISHTTTLTLNVVSGAPPPFDFNLSNNGNVAVTPGQAGSTTVTAGLLSGTSRSISFTASGLPAGATAAFSPTACTPSCSTTLTITTQTTISTGTFTVTVTGTAGSLTHTTTFSLIIGSTPPPPPPPPPGGGGGGAIAGGVAGGVASALLYYGKILISEMCRDVLTNGPLCKLAVRVAPYWVVTTDGPYPLAALIPASALGLAPLPVPGGYVLGFGIPSGAAFQLTLFYITWPP